MLLNPYRFTSGAIAYPELRSSGLAASLSATTHAGVLPSGWQVGDLCIVMAVFDGSSTIGLSAGWDFITERLNGVRGVVATRILQAGDSPITFTSSSVTRGRMICTAWKAGTFNSSIPVAASTSAGFGNAVSPAFTGAAANGTFIQWFGGEADTDITPTTYPLANNNLFTQSTSGGSSSTYVGLGMCSATNTSGAVSAGTFNLTNSTNYVGFALRIMA